MSSIIWRMLKTLDKPMLSGRISGSPHFGMRFVTPLLIGPMLNPMNSTMIAVALVPISQSLHIPTSKTMWLVIILYVVAAVFQPVLGTIADLKGPKKVFVAGLVITIVAGFLPMLSGSFTTAMVSRTLLGIGTSSAYPCAMKLLRDRSTASKRQTPPLLLSALSVSSLVTTAIGPVIGGALIVAMGWQAIFYVNVPLAGTTLVLAILWLPTDRDRPNPPTAKSVWQAIDLVGIGLFTLSIISFLVLLLLPSWSLSWLGIVAVISSIGFVKWELGRDRPFIDIRLLASNRALLRTYIRLLLTFSILYLFVTSLSQWLQTPFGWNAQEAGFAQVPIALVAAIASACVARSSRIRSPLLFAALAPLATGLTFAFVSVHSPVGVVIAGMMAIGIPQGLGSLSNQAALYRQAPAEQIGNAAGLSRTSIYLGAILSSSYISVISGAALSDKEMNMIGWLIVGLSMVILLLTVTDPDLTKADELTKSA